MSNYVVDEKRNFLSKGCTGKNLGITDGLTLEIHRQYRK